MAETGNIGRGLGKIEQSTMWGIGDWWARPMKLMRCSTNAKKRRTIVQI
jgi:hypothetical protein